MISGITKIIVITIVILIIIMNYVLHQLWYQKITVYPMGIKLMKKLRKII